MLTKAISLCAATLALFSGQAAKGRPGPSERLNRFVASALAGKKPESGEIPFLEETATNGRVQVNAGLAILALETLRNHGFFGANQLLSTIERAATLDSPVNSFFVCSLYIRAERLVGPSKLWRNKWLDLYGQKRDSKTLSWQEKQFVSSSLGSSNPDDRLVAGYLFAEKQSCDRQSRSWMNALLATLIHTAAPYRSYWEFISRVVKARNPQNVGKASKR